MLINCNSTNFQIWFPEPNFNNSKYIKNVLVHNLGNPALGYITKLRFREELGFLSLIFFVKLLIFVISPKNWNLTARAILVLYYMKTYYTG